MLLNMILSLVLLLVVILLIRATLYRCNPVAPKESEPIEVDEDRAAKNLSLLVQKRTVSSLVPSEIEEDEFSAFIELLIRLYPEAHQVLKREMVNQYGLLYHWKGANSDDPVVLMSHYDVVSAPPEGWKHGPFDGIIEDGIIWGRGTLDTKCTLVSIMEAVEYLIKTGFTPKHDIYLSFSDNEETSGESTPSIVALFKQRGITPGLVLDEGGAVVEKIFPGITQPIAVIGVAEKGVTDLEISIRSAGGHASTPPTKGPAFKLARAIMRIEKGPFRAYFPKPTAEMIQTLGRHASFVYRIIFANLWLFKPLLVQLFKRISGEAKAMCTTTVAITMLEGSKGANVLPAKVSAIANIRVSVESSVDEMLARLTKAINDPDVVLDAFYRGEPSPVSLMDEPYRFLGETIRDIYPNALIAPYVMLGASDSRHYATISPHVYRFSPFELSKEERDSLHAVNERIPVSKLAKGVAFYIRLIERS